MENNLYKGLGKKIIILFFLSILLLALFLLVFYFKINLENKNKIDSIEKNKTEKQLDVAGVLFNIEQNKQEIFLNFYTLLTFCVI